MTNGKRPSDENIIIIMHEDTWELMKEKLFDIAKSHSDPINYLKSMIQTEIVFDCDVPYGLTEIWDKDEYEHFNNAMNEYRDEEEDYDD